MGIFKKGDKITWRYEHHLNSKSSTYITKRGIFIREVTPSQQANMRRGGYSYNGTPEFAMVKFEGNKNPSKVIIKELRSAE